MTTHIRVVAPHFVAGLEVSDLGTVVDAAPILAWAIGKSWGWRVEPYFRRKRWRWQRLEVEAG